MKSADEQRIDPAAVASLYVQHAEELRCFLLGVLRNGDLTTEVLQNTFIKAMEQGHTAHEKTIKGWLFRVAFTEAMALRRREGVDRRAAPKVAVEEGFGTETPDELVCRWETVAEVRAAIELLPKEQQQVVRMRIYEQKKFVDIAAELKVPLGTVLTRMHAAVNKLRKHLERQ